VIALINEFKGIIVLIDLLLILLLPFLWHWLPKDESIARLYARPRGWATRSILTKSITIVAVFLLGVAIMWWGVFFNREYFHLILFGIWFVYLNGGLMLDAGKYFGAEPLEPTKSRPDGEVDGRVPTIGEALAVLEAQLAEAMEEISRLSGELSEVVTKIANLGERLRQNDANIEESSSDSEGGGAEIETLLAEATAEAERIQEEIGESEERAEDIRGEIVSIEQEVTKVESVKEAVEQEIEEKASTDSPIDHDSPYTESQALTDEREIEERILSAVGATSKRARTAFRLGFREED